MVSKKKSVKAIQPEINIGLIGHVDHGKTTLTERLSGKWTDTHSEEIKRGITIRLGYADTTFYLCEKCKQYTVKDKCEKCNGKTKFLRRVSFVDAPGHESLMATMLSGATIMDGAILLVAANELCPQPQTKEHLMALEIMGVKNVIVVQNKIDLVPKERAMKNYKQIKEFLAETVYKDAVIVPLSAQLGINIETLIRKIEEIIPTPERDDSLDPFMFITRSFDVNKPGTKISEIIGGILGGALKQGKLKVGQEIEIRPGIRIEEKKQGEWKPVISKIVTAMTGTTPIDEIGPGGSVAVQTYLDPSIVKSDQLSGSVIGLRGKLPDTLHEVTLELNLLDRVVGTAEEKKVDPIKINEALMMNINSASTIGIVSSIKGNKLSARLKLPICAYPGDRITLSRLIGNRFRLIGYGEIQE
jgi:translation initiation factor 2 subunit 3